MSLFVLALDATKGHKWILKLIADIKLDYTDPRVVAKQDITWEISIWKFGNSDSLFDNLYILLKYGFCINLLRYKWISDQLIIFSSLFDWCTAKPVKKWGKNVQLVRGSFVSNFLQNPYLRLFVNLFCTTLYLVWQPTSFKTLKWRLLLSGYEGKCVLHHWRFSRSNLQFEFPAYNFRRDLGLFMTVN